MTKKSSYHRSAIKTYNGTWLAREIAYRCRFTYNDVNIILNEIKIILSEIIARREAISIYGLFKLWVREIPPHKGWDGYRNKEVFLKKGFHTHMVASPSLSIALKVQEGLYKDDDLKEGTEEENNYETDMGDLVE